MRRRGTDANGSPSTEWERERDRARARERAIVALNGRRYGLNVASGCRRCDEPS